MNTDQEVTIDSYLKRLSVTPDKFWRVSELPLVNIRAVILLAINDFINEKISADALSYIGLRLNTGSYAKWHSNDIWNYDRELAQLLWDLFMLTETDDLIDRNDPTLKNAVEYFKKYKYVVESILNEK
jgi:hypothetical protein